MNDKKYVITIGRQFGSGGRELGRLLSQKLGIAFYDKELLMKAAQESGISPQFFEKNDERIPKFINGLIPLNFGMSALPWYSGSSSISDDNLYRLQSDFILKIAEQGPCVIVGRSADYILRNQENVINVFINAEPMDCALRILKRSDSQDTAKALKLAERINKLRSNYYNFYTDKKWGDAASYDLTFNSSKISIEDICDLVIEYIKHRLK